MFCCTVRTVVAVLALAGAFPGRSSIVFTPITPTDQSFVVLQIRDIWRDGCLPQRPTVTRLANAIEVLWSLPGGGCPQALRPWTADVPIGVLEAGEYDVTLRVDSVIANRRLVVMNAAPSLLVAPGLLNSNVSTEVTINSASSAFCPPGPRPAQVTVGGVSVPFRQENCSLIATLPPHSPGSVTIAVRAGEREDKVIAAVHYVDPDAAPEPALFERVLVPVLFNGPGAFGSQWITDVRIANVSSHALNWVPRVAFPLDSLEVGETKSLAGFGGRPSGLVLFLPRGDDVRFGGVFRDASRETSDRGTELPVVREREIQSSVHLLNVPFDSHSRLHLRIYGIDGSSFPATVIVSQAAFAQMTEVFVTGPCAQGQLPCNSNEPAHRSIDLGAAFPTLTGGGYRVTVLPGQLHFATRLWAFVTVTNNNTHHVTTITPQ